MNIQIFGTKKSSDTRKAERFFKERRVPFQSVDMRRHAPGMTILCDPSHIGGKREYVEPLAQQALDMGFDGLMIESHCHPDQALSDSAQQVTPQQLKSILERLVVRSGTLLDDELALLRQQIDDCDHELLAVLARRMSVARQIGRFKKEHNIAIIQPKRWDSLLDDMIEKGKSYGLTEEFIRAMFNAIHDASVAEQNKILEQ